MEVYNVKYYKSGIYEGIYTLKIEEEVVSGLLIGNHQVTPSEIKHKFTLIKDDNLIDEYLDQWESNYIFKNDRSNRDIRFENQFLEVELTRPILKSICEDVDNGVYEYEYQQDYYSMNFDVDKYQKYLIRKERKNKLDRIRESDK